MPVQVAVFVEGWPCLLSKIFLRKEPIDTKMCVDVVVSNISHSAAIFTLKLVCWYVFQQCSVHSGRPKYENFFSAYLVQWLQK